MKYISVLTLSFFLWMNLCLMAHPPAPESKQEVKTSPEVFLLKNGDRRAVIDDSRAKAFK